MHGNHPQIVGTRHHRNLTSARRRMGWTTWWLWRGARTRSHPELGRENPQRPWYCVSRRGRVGRRQVFQPIRISLPDAGWSSPVARQAHNLKAAGSNPAPATTSRHWRPYAARPRPPRQRSLNARRPAAIAASSPLPCASCSASMRLWCPGRAWAHQACRNCSATEPPCRSWQPRWVEPAPSR